MQVTTREADQIETLDLRLPGLPLVHSRAGPVLKRLLDAAAAVMLCVFLSPLLVVVAAAIKLDSRGPVFFRQRRRGRGFSPIRVTKFRSLTHGVPDPSVRYEMQAQDPRITRVGAFIRRTSIDELPQLFNVVSGSMSLVGPRPLVEWESLEALDTHPERFSMKPGITGLSQVWRRNSVDPAARLDKDVEYVRGWSLLLDARILLRTPWVVLAGNGIYPETQSRESNAAKQ